MEREITLSSFAVKNVRGNRPGDFTTRFTPTIQLGNDASYYIGFNRIISMSFSWTNVNEGYNNQKIAFSKDDGRTWTDIDFAKGVWTYHDFDKYIKEETRTIDGEGNEDYPITLTFDDPTFRVIITLATNYQLDLTKSNFNELIGYDKKILKEETNIGVRVPNLTQDTDVLNIHCDLISDSLVDGEESDIIYSFGTSTLRASYGFVLEPRRVIFNPVNKTTISSIRIYITDGLRRPVYLNNADTAFSLILKRDINKNFQYKYMMKSREFKKIYHPKLGGYVYEHRGNGLIVDNIMKPLKAGLSTAANKAARAIVSKLSKGAKAKAKAIKTKAEEKSGDLIRQRLSGSRGRQGRTPKTSQRSKATNAKMTRNEVNTLINNLIARS